MNHELAKELRDAGFPYHWDKAANPEPLLKLLIEACGEGFRDLCYHPEGFYISDGARKWNTNRDDLWHCELEPSTTPEEAVARLWLSLNRKKSGGL